MEEIRAQLALILLLQVIQILNQAGQGDGALVRLLPRVRDYARRGIYTLDVKLQKRRKPKDKDFQPLPVPFDEVGFRRFCGALLAAVNRSASIEDVKVTEGERGKYGLSRDEFIVYRAKLEEKGIVCIIDKRGTRGWRADQNGSYGWARGRLERLARDNSPAPASPTAKTR